MRGVTDGKLELNDRVRQHLELCLDCRACETACPSGVQYGKLIEPFRVAMDSVDGEPKRNDWFHRWILFGLFPYSHKLRRALLPARIAQRTGLMTLLQATRLTRLLPVQLRRMVEMLPPPRRNEGQLPEFLPAIGRRRATVALFTGCIGDAMFRHVNWATARVLQQNGCDVHVPRTQVCCGAIHFHAGSSEPARQFADENLAAFPIERFDATINNIAGCGSMLKDYGHHWHDAHAGRSHCLVGQGSRRERIPRSTRPRAARGRNSHDRNVPRCLPPAPRPKDPRCTAQLVGPNSRPGYSRSAGIGALLRRGRYLQPHAAGNVGPAQSSQDGKHQEDWRSESQLRRTLAVRCKLPARLENRASKSPWFIRWKCWIGVIARWATSIVAMVATAPTNAA